MTREHSIGNAPIEPALRGEMNDLARAIDRYFNGDARGADRKVGFLLMAFRFGDNAAGDHRCNYISNADREDVIVLLKEQIAYFEGQPEQSGRA